MDTIRATTPQKQRDNGGFGPSEKPGNPPILFAHRQGSEVIPQALARLPVTDGNSGESNPNECAVILDSDSAHADALVDALQEAEIDAMAFQDKQKFLEYLARQPVNVAILVLHSKSWWKDELRLFANSIHYLKETPELICVLGWPPEGPLDRLYGEALGVAVLHA
jgi:hypothetical protein